MVSNVGSTGGADGGAPFRHVNEGASGDEPAFTTRRQDDRFPESAGRTRAPTPIKAAQLAPDTAGQLQASHGADRVIDPGYIEVVEAKAIAAYPSDGNYAPRVFRFPPSLPNAVGGARHTISPYNPLNLRLPFHLTGFAILYDWELVVGDEARAKAITSHLELAKQYNLAYVDFLRAANGSDEALARLKTILGQGKIWDAAGVQATWLDIDSQSLLHEIQGHLCLDVLRSVDAEIPTTARIRALEIVRDHFDVATVAEVLGGVIGDNTGRGLFVRSHEKIYDLIPERFITNEDERTKSHASRFLQNQYVKSIFFASRTRDRPFNLSALELASKYPEEAVQTLLAVVRVGAPSERASAFKALINLTRLDESLKERIFGVNASYRNEGKSRIESPARIDGDLDPNDPAGYFRALCLHPDTPDEDIIALAQATYSILAAKYGDDTSAPDAERAAKIAVAYEVLTNPATLQQYRRATQ